MGIGVTPGAASVGASELAAPTRVALAIIDAGPTIPPVTEGGCPITTGIVYRVAFGACTGGEALVEGTGTRRAFVVRFTASAIGAITNRRSAGFVAAGVVRCITGETTPQ